MNTFDRHLLREWLQILFLVAAAMMGLLLVQICYDELPKLLEAGAYPGEVAKFFLVTIPSFLGYVLPLAMLFSLLFTLTKLHRSNEVTAMRAAGVGIFRLTASVWLVGVVACAIMWWLNSAIVPWSVEISRSLEARILYRQQVKTLTADRVGAVTDVAFDEPQAGRMWFFNRYSPANGHGYGVTVTELDAQRRPKSQIMAGEGWPELWRGGWFFRDGRLLQFNSETGDWLTDEPFDGKFVPGLTEDPQLMLMTDERPRDLSFFQLHRLMQYFRVQNPSKEILYAVRYYSIIADTLGPLVVIAIAIPFAVTGVRVNPAVGVSKSIGLFVFYYLLNTAAAIFATRGWVDPQWAAWLPNVGISCLALFFFIRIR